MLYALAFCAGGIVGVAGVLCLAAAMIAAGKKTYYGELE